MENDELDRIVCCLGREKVLFWIYQLERHLSIYFYSYSSLLCAPKSNIGSSLSLLSFALLPLTILSNLPIWKLQLMAGQPLTCFKLSRSSIHQVSSAWLWPITTTWHTKTTQTQLKVNCSSLVASLPWADGNRLASTGKHQPILASLKWPISRQLLSMLVMSPVMRSSDFVCRFPLAQVHENFLSQAQSRPSLFREPSN